jgi:hypothetical protein
VCFADAANELNPDWQPAGPSSGSYGGLASDVLQSRNGTYAKAGDGRSKVAAASNPPRAAVGDPGSGSDIVTLVKGSHFSPACNAAQHIWYCGEIDLPCS